jgi:hypothetical protein
MAVAVSFAWLGVDVPSKWEAGVALYILGCKYSCEFTLLTTYLVIPGSDHIPGRCC